MGPGIEGLCDRVLALTTCTKRGTSAGCGGWLCVRGSGGVACRGGAVGAPSLDERPLTGTTSRDKTPRQCIWGVTPGVRIVRAEEAVLVLGTDSAPELRTAIRRPR